MSDLTATRSSLHAVAELLLAGPQYERSGTIKLRVTPGGYGTVATPDVRVEGGVLRHSEQTLELAGRTVAEVAAAAGLAARPLDDVYTDGCGLTVDHSLQVEDTHAAEIAEAFRLGDEALAALAPDAERVIWPEHFDLGVTVGEVNFGISPGDSHLEMPYAYVGPWSRDGLTGEFWNAPFGSARPIADLGGAAALLDYFREGRDLAG
jgi:hypothetical protein